METIGIPIVRVQWWDLEENLEEISGSFLKVVESLGPLAIETLLWGFYLVWDNKQGLDLLLQKQLERI